MTIQLTTLGLRKIFPKAPQAVLDAFLAKQRILDRAGITHTRNRLAIAFAQIEHETAGFTIPRLTENINYSPERAAQIWPSRFKSVEDVYAKTGSAPGDLDFKRKLMNCVYGGRMGNRPGTDDGHKYIGRGGPQVTGFDGYVNVAKHGGVPIDRDAELATKPEVQPELLAGFWTWKGLNAVADGGGLKAVTKIWNGGFIGMADREAKLAGNDPVISKLEFADDIKPVLKDLPGDPPTPAPPPEVFYDATKRERAIRNTGVGTTVATGTAKGAEAEKTTPVDAVVGSFILWTAIGVAVGVTLIGAILVKHREQKVVENWN